MQRQSLLRHVRKQHAGHWTCLRCSATFTREDEFSYHQRTCEFRATGKRPADTQIGGGAPPKRQRTSNVEWRAQALDHVFDEYSIDLERLDQTPENILDVLKNAVLDLKDTIEKEIEKKRALKVVVALHLNFHQSADTTFRTNPPVVFNSDVVEVLTSTDLDEALNSIFEKLLKLIEEFQERGSGWVLHELLRLDLHTYAFDPLRGSTYIPLPDDLMAKQALINIQNNDDKCFIWCILAAIYADSVTHDRQRFTLPAVRA